MWQPPGPSQSGEHGASGNHPLVVSKGKGKWRTSIDDPLVLPKGQDNLWALPRKRGQGRASGDYLLIVSKRRCQSPGPSQREGIGKGKRWQHPGRTRKGTTPGLFPKERLREGKHTTPGLFPKKREGIRRQPPWLVLSEGKDQGRVNRDDPLAPPNSKGHGRVSGDFYNFFRDRQLNLLVYASECQNLFAWFKQQNKIYMDDLAATRMTNELDMSFVMLRHVCFLFRSVIRPASDLFPFCFKHKPFDLHWMVGSFFKTLMVTHFTPHGWGKMGHSRNKKKGGLPPLKFVFLS